MKLQSYTLYLTHQALIQVVLIKIIMKTIMIQYLFGITSMRQKIREIKVNISDKMGSVNIHLIRKYLITQLLIKTMKKI